MLHIVGFVNSCTIRSHRSVSSQQTNFGRELCCRFIASAVQRCFLCSLTNTGNFHQPAQKRRQGQLQLIKAIEHKSHRSEGATICHVIAPASYLIGWRSELSAGWAATSNGPEM